MVHSSSSEMEGQKFKVIFNYTVSFKDILKICFTLYILAMRSIEAWDTPVLSVVSRSADGSPNKPWLDTAAEQRRLAVWKYTALETLYQRLVINADGIVRWSREAGLLDQHLGGKGQV